MRTPYQQQLVMITRWLLHILLPSIFNITTASALQASYNQLR